MLTRQVECLPRPDFLETVQEGTIKARMRQRLADWMLDVCELFEVAKEVFALSMMLLVSIPWVAIRGNVYWVWAPELCRPPTHTLKHIPIMLARRTATSPR